VTPVEKSVAAAWPNEKRALTIAFAFLGGSFVLIPLAPALAVPALVVGNLGFFGALATAFRRPQLEVGSDGVRIDSRFLSFDELVRVEDDESDYGRRQHLAWLVLQSGERIRLGARLGLIGHAALGAVDEAYQMLNRKIDEHRRRERTAHAGQLERGNQALTDWIASVRRRSMDPSFRDTWIPRHELLAVVEDPTAPQSARAAAALALKTGLEEPERVRVRVAAAATAAPKVRVALETVADESATVDRAAAFVSRVAR